MNQDQLMLRGLRAENAQLRAHIEAMKKAEEQHKFIEALMCAALSGATARIEDPAAAAKYAFAAMNATVAEFDAMTAAALPESTEEKGSTDETPAADAGAAAGN